jgi:hypothetical protein
MTFFLDILEFLSLNLRRLAHFGRDLRHLLEIFILDLMRSLQVTRKAGSISPA